MKTNTQLDQDILDITMKIQSKFPELVKYIEEMPLKVSGTDNEGLEEYYNSLKTLLNDYTESHKPLPLEENKIMANIKPLDYSSNNNIYVQDKEETDIEQDDFNQIKSPNELPGQNNEKDFDEDMSGDDLDIPGSELDDQQENVGSEDEENNYYSLGGDNHDN